MKLQLSPWLPSQYELLDFGQGRKLERFGALVLDRVCPAAEGVWTNSGIDWATAHLRLDAHGQLAHAAPDLPESWPVHWQSLAFKLKLTPFGHVGLFPEQVHSWNWLASQLDDPCFSGRTLRALNLFAYTGGTSLVLARLGARVVHVDASAPAIAWARSNAAASGLASCPVRWILEDARKFVARELRRHNVYDIIVLDPPSFGHGVANQRWELARHLPPLLDDCARLLSSDSSLLLFTSHSAHPDAAEVRSMWLESLGRTARQMRGCEADRLVLRDRSGRHLDCGFTVRGRIARRADATGFC